MTVGAGDDVEFGARGHAAVSVFAANIGLDTDGGQRASRAMRGTRRVKIPIRLSGSWLSSDWRALELGGDRSHRPSIIAQRELRAAPVGAA